MKEPASKGQVSSILSEIVERRRRDVASLKQRLNLGELEKAASAAPRRSLAKALTSKVPAVIAEYKIASPSAGVIRDDLSCATVASDYERHGAAALSILTEPHYFQGRLEFLREARDAVQVPLLRKDFFVDPIQVAEGRAAGADAFLVIAAASEDGLMRELIEAGKRLGMDALVEVHDEEDLERAVEADAEIIGINNRCLKTFRVDIETTLRLASKVPPGKIIVSESGIRSRDDMDRCREAGVNAFLVGTALMRRPSPGAALADLLAGGTES